MPGRVLRPGCGTAPEWLQGRGAVAKHVELRAARVQVARGLLDERDLLALAGVQERLGDDAAGGLRELDDRLGGIVGLERRDFLAAARQVG